MEKRASWEYGIGLAQLDGVAVSDELLELAEKEICGEITIDEIREILLKKYTVQKENKQSV